MLCCRLQWDVLPVDAAFTLDVWSRQHERRACACVDLCQAAVWIHTRVRMQDAPVEVVIIRQIPSDLPGKVVAFLEIQALLGQLVVEEAHGVVPSTAAGDFLL